MSAPQLYGLVLTGGRSRRMQRAEHGERFDGLPGEIGGHVVGDDRKAKHPNFEPLACRLNRFEILASESSEAQQERSRYLRIGRRGAA